MGRNPKIFIALLMIVIAGSVVFFHTTRWHKTKVRHAVEAERGQWDQQRDQLDKQIEDLQDEISLHKETIIPEDRLEEVFGKQAGQMAEAPGQAGCQVMDKEIMDFFSYLDRRDYIQRAGLKNGTYARYQQLVKKLSRNPPLILEEMKDTYALMKNVAHFYRILGKKNLLLIREVLRHESEVIEPVAALFYEWFVSGDRCKDGLKGRPSLDTTYEYAAFFLNTLAGRSYLLRQNSRIRILTTYYSILVIDLANKQRLNQYGLDIRPFIDTTIHDIRNRKDLVYKKQYIDKLEALKKQTVLE